MLAIIPVRLRSSATIFKNLRPFAGLPLFVHAVSYARQEGLRSIVATSDPAVVDICRRYGIPVFAGEPPSQQGDIFALLRLVAKNFTTDKHFAVLQPTSPFRTPGLLAALSRRLVAGETPGFFTARKCKPQGITEVGGERIASNAGRRQDCKDWHYFFDGNLFLYTREAIENSGNDVITPEWKPIEQSGLPSLDIDTPEDFDLASRLADSPAASPLLPARHAMRIAIVSNCPWWERDVSDLIDSHDLVVRINDLSSLDTGRTGKRTDLAFLLPSDNYLAHLAETQHGDALRQARRVIFARQCFTHPGSHNRMLVVVTRHQIHNWACTEEGYVQRLQGRTPFFEAAYLCTRYFPGARITLFGDRGASTRALEHTGPLAEIEDNEFDALTARYNFSWVLPQ